MPENSGPNQDTRFKSGQSGNPRGKPKGARHKLTVLAEKLMAEDAEAVVAKVIEMAKSGDMQAARVILDRILPPTKGRPIAIKLPHVSTVDDVLEAQGAVIAAMACGQVTPDEASTIAGILEAKRKAIETVELERRLTAVEVQAAKR